MNRLWEPVTFGNLTLSNRLAMAPMTRSRATTSGAPTELNAQYYAQRASVGVIISEGTQPSEDGQGYLLTPGIHTAEHVAGWRRVTDAVHAAGGRIVLQIMHVGRISHPSNTPHGRQALAPSAVQPAGKLFTPTGLEDIPVPREMTTEDIARTIDDFRRAAALAIEAGADGVELHGANGYLLHQFLAENTNRRTDEYGGGPAQRIRFVVEVARAVAAEIGAARTGIRLSPGNPYNDIVEGDTQALYRALIPALAELDLGFLHLVNDRQDELLQWARPRWPTALVVNRPGRAREDIAVDVEAGLADIASVGAFALANPDLVARLRTGAPLVEPDRATFFGGDARGYTDYPTLAV